MAKDIMAQALGQRGGNATKKKLGIEHYKAISQKAAEIRTKKRLQKLSPPSV